MKDDIQGEVVLLPASFIFKKKKTKSLGTSSVSSHVHSEVVFMVDDFIFRFFFWTISGKKNNKLE